MEHDVIDNEHREGTVMVREGSFAFLLDFAEAVCERCGAGGRSNCHRLSRTEAYHEQLAWARNHRCLVVDPDA